MILICFIAREGILFTKSTSAVASEQHSAFQQCLWKPFGVGTCEGRQGRGEHPESKRVPSSIQLLVDHALASLDGSLYSEMHGASKPAAELDQFSHY